MSYQPIENYGIVGNMRTVALVSMNGSLDWFCFPHFDSPSVFAALLDDKQGGRFLVTSTHEHVQVQAVLLARHERAGDAVPLPRRRGRAAGFHARGPARRGRRQPIGSSAGFAFPAARWSFACGASRPSTMRGRRTSTGDDASTASSSAREHLALELVSRDPVKTQRRGRPCNFPSEGRRNGRLRSS